MPQKSIKEGVKMIKQEIVVKEGYEEIYNKLVDMKGKLEEKIRKQVEEEAKTIDNMICECTDIVEVEVEDVIEETNEEIAGE